MKRALVFCLVLLSACDSLPRDPAGTSDRIARTRTFTVAAVDPSVRAAPEVGALLQAIARTTGARPAWREGTGETVLEALDQGKLDLAIGRFTKSSPWENQIALAPPLATSRTDDAQLELRAAARNGENRWIMTVERASRTVPQRTGGR
ncbi:hypothetical protein [Sphingomonas sp. ID0503]|uniref:hypothetical protein n=1 Tax=Sphingomonas sp. ID0503 TaxID=3399691 RepID=UPI003AFB76AD